MIGGLYVYQSRCGGVGLFSCYSPSQGSSTVYGTGVPYNMVDTDDDSLPFVTLSMFIIDEFSFLDEQGHPTGHSFPPQES